MKKLLILMFVSLFSFMSCKSKKKAAAEAKAKTEQEVVQNVSTDNQTSTPQDQARRAPMVASIEKTACYGRCPVFKAEIYLNGDVVYTGKANVKYIGKHHGRISYEQIQTLQKKAKDINYASLKDDYDNKRVTDLPATITYMYFVDDNIKKQVRVRHEAPEELYYFQKDFYELIKGLELIKVEEAPKK